MRPPYNPGKADGDISISASRLHMKLKFSGMVKETRIFNLNIKVIQAIKSSHNQKQKTFHQGGPHASTYSSHRLYRWLAFSLEYEESRDITTPGTN